MPNLKFVTNTAGDWEAIYVDDTLHYEGYSIRPFQWQWLKCFNLGVTGALEYEVTSKYLDEMGGSYPYYFNDIPKEAFV